MPATAIRLRPLSAGLVEIEKVTSKRLASASFTRNFEYKADGSAQARLGLSALIDNPPAAIKIANFEAAENWQYSSYSSGAVATDAAVFRVHEAEADGVVSRLMVVPPATSRRIRLTGVWALGNNARNRTISLWVNWNQATPQALFFLILRFTDGAGNGFQKTFSGLELTVQNEWIVLTVRLEEFTSIGSALSWDAITAIDIESTNASTTSILNIHVDNLYRGPAAIMGLHQLKRSPVFGSDSFLYAYAESGIYVANFSTGRWTLLVPNLTSTTPQGPVGHFVTFNERAWFVNGKDRGVQLLDALRWFYASPTPPTLELAAAALGAGNIQLAGDYFWRFTWFNKTTGKESAPLPLSDTPTLANAPASQRYSLTRQEAPGPNEGASHWIIYRKGPGSTVYRRISSPDGDPAIDPTGMSAIPIAVLTTTDNTPEASLGLELQTEDDLPMPLLSVIEEFDGSIAGIGATDDTGTVYWNNPPFPEAWGLNNFQVLGEGDTSPLTALRGFASRLWAGRDSEWYEGVRVNLRDWIFTARRTGRGGISHGAAVVARGALFYASKDGFYYLPGDGFPKCVTELIPETIGSLARAMISRSSAIYEDKPYRVYWLVGTGASAVPQYVLAYSIHPRVEGLHGDSVGAWEVHEIPGTRLLMYEDPEQREFPVIAHVSGLICRLFDGGTDLGTAIRAVHRTQFLDCGSPDLDKSMDYCDFDCGPASASAALHVKFFVDGKSAADSERDFALATTGGFGPFPIIFSGQGSFARLKGPRMGKWRRVAVELSHQGVGERVFLDSIALGVHRKSGRYRR